MLLFLVCSTIKNIRDLSLDRRESGRFLSKISYLFCTKGIVGFQVFGNKEEVGGFGGGFAVYFLFFIGLDSVFILLGVSGGKVWLSFYWGFAMRGVFL